MNCGGGAERGGEGVGYGGHGVGTPSPFRPSLSPGGVAPAARWPASAHTLPTGGRVVGCGAATSVRAADLPTGDPS